MESSTSKTIFLDAPNLGKEEKEYLCRAVDSNYVSTIGPFVPEFEERFAQWIGVKRAVSLQSGTAALHMALCEMGIGSEDEVIVPALSFIATVNPVMYVHATPVFVDVDMNTWNIIPDEVEKAITSRTKAIIVTHLYGNPCDMDPLMEISRKHGIPLIEDAAESLGATYRDLYTGTFGDFGCYSFNGNKIITTGGGGMILGQDEKKLMHIKHVINQAVDRSRGYYSPEIGFNYRMTNIEAALGLAQMEKIDAFLDKKRKFHATYLEDLHMIPGIRFQREYPESCSSWWLNGAVFDSNINIKEVSARLLKDGIQTRSVFYPLVDLPPYKPYQKKDYPNARSVYERGLCFPGSTLNTVDDIHYVCLKLKKVLKNRE
ncbi:aminotransferase class V-fold PLP-dependent enzyme [Candidatus Sumerlaeota bacterium]|nr:aminotransferase class V-fold PLP-dependent enzyme [Candidatus Sumerlaeota bacterium]